MAIRAGEPADQASINDMVAGDRLNPMTVNAENFLLATDRGVILGAVQLRRHADHAHELATLVVEREHRGRGIASRLIEALLVRQRAPVFMITGRAHTDHYSRWGFRPIARRDAPASIRFNHSMGQLAGLFSLLRGRRPRGLAILKREFDANRSAGS